MQQEPAQWKRFALPIIIAVVVVVAFIFLSLLSAIQHHGKVKVNVQAAPSKITLKVDGKKVSTNGTLYVIAGTHRWEASFNGFTSKSGNFSAEGKSVDLLVYLEPSGAAGTKYLNDNPKEKYSIEGIVGQAVTQDADRKAAAQPFVKQLPSTGPGFEYQIDAGATPKDAKYPDQPGIYISADTDTAKADALAWIRDAGGNPDTMNIVYQPLGNTQ
ncbi:MAG TPA: hypothetical protein VF466_04280 [Candidatus Saccharimonadales bacterium]